MTMSPQQLPEAAIPDQLGAGTGVVGTLVLNATQTLQVPLQPVLPTTPTNATAVVSGGAVSVLANLQVQSVTPVSGSRVDVVVKNVGVVTIAGATVLVVATT